MTNTSIKAGYLKERKTIREEWKAKNIAKLKEAVPGLEIDESKAQTVDVTDLAYRLNNREYYHVNIYGVTLRKTKLGLYIEMAEESKKKYGSQYEIFETDNKVYLIEELISSQVFVHEFFKDSGNKVKGKRRSRKVNKSTKGSYITLEGKRHYVSFLNEKEERDELISGEIVETIE